MLRGKSEIINPYIKKMGRNHINDLTVHFKDPEKQEQTKPKFSRKKKKLKLEKK